MEYKNAIIQMLNYLDVKALRRIYQLTYLLYTRGKEDWIIGPLFINIKCFIQSIAKWITNMYYKKV